jgi:hypothetical protein
MILEQHEKRGSPETGQPEQLRLHDKGQHEHEVILFSLRFCSCHCEFRGSENNIQIKLSGLFSSFYLYDRYRVLKFSDFEQVPSVQST